MHMIAGDIDIDDWERRAVDRTLWGEKVARGTRTSEAQRAEAATAKRSLGKEDAQTRERVIPR